MDTQATAARYPLRLSIDYPDRDLNRLTTFFRIIVAIPIIIVLATVSGGAWGGGWERGRDYVEFSGAAGGGLLFIPPLLMILFRQKYPRWWFEWNLNLTRFSNRVFAYLALMDDRYPSTDEEQAVHIEIDYPDAKRDLNRWLPLVKWLLAIPHFIVLVVLAVAAIVVVDHRVVRDPVHREIPAWHVRLRRRCLPMGRARPRLRALVGDGSIPGVLAQGLNEDTAGAPGGSRTPNLLIRSQDELSGVPGESMRTSRTNGIALVICCRESFRVPAGGPM